jgi:hypothetical protein
MTETEVRAFLAQFDAARREIDHWPQWMQDAARTAAATFPRTAGVRVPVVVDGRTEEEWCQEACRIGAYDYVEVIEGVKGRWIRTFTGERTPEKIEQSIKGLKAQAERYDRAHGVGGPDGGKQHE